MRTCNEPIDEKVVTKLEQDFASFHFGVTVDVWLVLAHGFGCFGLTLGLLLHRGVFAQGGHWQIATPILFIAAFFGMIMAWVGQALLYRLRNPAASKWLQETQCFYADLVDQVRLYNLDLQKNEAPDLDERQKWHDEIMAAIEKGQSTWNRALGTLVYHIENPQS